MWNSLSGWIPSLNAPLIFSFGAVFAKVRGKAFVLSFLDSFPLQLQWVRRAREPAHLDAFQQLHVHSRASSMLKLKVSGCPPSSWFLLSAWPDGIAWT